MAKYEFLYGCVKNQEVEFESTTSVSLTKKDFAEMEQFIIEHDYSPEFVDIPNNIYDKCLKQAIEVAISAFPPFAQPANGYEIGLSTYIPDSFIGMLSEDTQNKLYENMPEDDEDYEGEDDAWGTPEGAFQLSVEDMFQITGIGVSLSGIVDSGTVHSGDAVIIAGDDAQIDGVVKHVELNRQIGDSAQAGDEIGLVVKGLTRKDIKALGDNLFVVRADEVE